ncbi:hypothetical protein R3P38DRAFT_3221641 [Favolaschia claudopus]|uniref:Uncharacterized protein n=1 Tax=Favolaschia claudopus TaxID=2862362 RepID=A0AAV9ZZM5_9AGAR
MQDPDYTALTYDMSITSTLWGLPAKYRQDVLTRVRDRFFRTRGANTPIRLSRNLEIQGHAEAETAYEAAATYYKNEHNRALRRGEMTEDETLFSSDSDDEMGMETTPAQPVIWMATDPPPADVVTARGEGPAETREPISLRAVAAVFGDEEVWSSAGPRHYFEFVPVSSVPPVDTELVEQNWVSIAAPRTAAATGTSSTAVNNAPVTTEALEASLRARQHWDTHLAAPVGATSAPAVNNTTNAEPVVDIAPASNAAEAPTAAVDGAMAADAVVDIAPPSNATETPTAAVDDAMAADAVVDIAPPSNATETPTAAVDDAMAADGTSTAVNDAAATTNAAALDESVGERMWGRLVSLEIEEEGGEPDDSNAIAPHILRIVSVTGWRNVRCECRDGKHDPYKRRQSFAFEADDGTVVIKSNKTMLLNMS